jgi:peptidoglycan hydrolase-like protein with peptidoglycan-binding domain
VLEARADAELTLAEVKLCEVNALRIKEQLDAAEAGKLKLGSKGVEVRALQQMLNAHVRPSPKLNVDGDFGPLTESAVKKFQQANGLPDTGIVDEKTAMVVGMAMHRGGGADGYQPSFPPADVLIEAPIEVRKRIEANLSREERGKPRIIAGGEGGGKFRAGKKPEPAKVHLQKERAVAAAEAAAAKQSAIAEQRAQWTERRAHTEALRAELDAMRAALRELQEQVEETEREAVEEHEAR